MCILLNLQNFIVLICSVDGGWSPWYNQTKCSASCGGGTLTQWRNCTQPSPDCGGSDCEGENIITIDCNTQCCPGIYVNAIIVGIYCCIMQLMAVGQTGQLGIVQNHVVEEFNLKLEAAVIHYHPVGERTVMVHQK